MKTIEIFNKIATDSEGFYENFSLEISQELQEKLLKRVYSFEFRANIILTDVKRHKNFVLSLAKNKQAVYEGFSSDLGFSLIGPLSVWEKIARKEQTLLESVVTGEIVVPNMRANFSKINKFSFLISYVPETIKIPNI